MGIYFLLTHPIPYEMLGVDLHTVIGKKIGILMYELF